MTNSTPEAGSLRLPFWLTYRDTVVGNGYVAEVVCRGRVLATYEDDGPWISGVNPGDVSAGGATPSEALGRYRKHYREVLEDIASEAEDFGAFRDIVREFVCTPNEPVLAEWLDAVENVRRLELASKLEREMRVEPADGSPVVTVTERPTSPPVTDRVLDIIEESQKSLAA